MNCCHIFSLSIWMALYHDSNTMYGRQWLWNSFISKLLFLKDCEHNEMIRLKIPKPDFKGTFGIGVQWLHHNVHLAEAIFFQLFHFIHDLVIQLWRGNTGVFEIIAFYLFSPHLFWMSLTVNVAPNDNENVQGLTTPRAWLFWATRNHMWATRFPLPSGWRGNLNIVHISHRTKFFQMLLSPDISWKMPSTYGFMLQDTTHKLVSCPLWHHS